MRRILAVAVMTVCLALLSVNLYGMDKDINEQRNRDKEIEVLQKHVYELEQRVAYLESRLNRSLEFIEVIEPSDMTPPISQDNVIIDEFLGLNEPPNKTPLFGDTKITEPSNEAP